MLKLGLDLMEVIEQLNDGLYFTDHKRQITFWNQAAEAITGYKAEEVIGRRCSDNILMHVDAEGRSLCQGRCPLAETMRDERARKGEVFLMHKDGHRIPVAVRTSLLRDGGGEIVGGAELFTDVSAQHALAEEMEQLKALALVDPLTQIANRRRLEAEVQAALNLYERDGVCSGLLFLDIDHFKRFNDDHGHDVGDLALQATARTLKHATRSYDVVGRWGGEEFVVLFRNTYPQLVEMLAARLCALIRATQVQAPGGALGLTASIGATIARKGDSVDALIKRADGLMYQSKANGRDRVTFGA
ncbi:sensor domain-containing diguanylate cyclase [Myxococcota bacterium]|nr:sensor domain-containing diguanylate cyclase [Myxococcota bacterium]MBU1432386.1 sensor domain-containing diguanylate cyclase [Myxococcota bacterium]MBU1897834.1 sensor domain-containing diguanylate cyclase [Myxococcota bacterium]